MTRLSANILIITTTKDEMNLLEENIPHIQELLENECKTELKVNFKNGEENGYEIKYNDFKEEEYFDIIKASSLSFPTFNFILKTYNIHTNAANRRLFKKGEMTANLSGDFFGEIGQFIFGKKFIESYADMLGISYN